MAKQSTATARTAFLNTAKKNAKKWEKGREAKPGEGFKVPEIDDGLYDAKVTGSYEIGQRGKWKGHAIAHLTASIDGGQFDGVELDQPYDLSSEEDWPSEALARDLKCIMPDRADEIAEADIAGLVSVLEDLRDNPVSMQVEAKNGEKNGKKFVNIRFPFDASAQEQESDEGGSNEESTDESDDEPADDGGDDYAPEKGDKVGFEFRKRDYTGEIVSVNKGEETCRVKDSKSGKVFGPMGWDKISPME